MSITDIKDKIVSEGEEQKREIKENFEQKIQKIQKDFSIDAKKLREGFEKELLKSLEENKRKFLSLANREEKIKQENLKREILDEVISEALTKLDKVSDENFEEFALKIFEVIPSGLKGDVVVSSDKSHAVKKAMKGHHLSLKEDNSLSGGFVIVGDDFRYDFTFENLLRSRKSDFELELSKILFS